MELYVEGPHLIIGSITFAAYNKANVGFRLTDTLREKTNARIPVQFSVENEWPSRENLCTFSFHVVADCRGSVKLQVITSDNSSKHSAFINTNGMYSGIKNQHYDHKTICTLSAIPLGEIEEQKYTPPPSTRQGRRAIGDEAEQEAKVTPKHPDKSISTSSLKPSQ